MDLLIVESLETELMGWLRDRYSVVHAPELAFDQAGLLRVLGPVRSMIVPPTITVDARTLQHAPQLRAVGRITAGSENIDLDACAQAHVEVVRSTSGTAQAEAEFMMGAMLQMLRRVPVTGLDGMRVGRELGGATVGLVGLAPAARTMSRMLSAFGARVVGYDPAVHVSDSVWGRWNVAPLGLRELLEQCDAVCVQLSYFSRYRGLLGDRFLPYCKPNQVLVSIGHSGLFDAEALAEVLTTGRMAAAWLDSLEPGALRRGQPLHGVENLQITPRIASTTIESRRRCAWAVVKRIDQVLNEAPVPPAESFRTTGPWRRSNWSWSRAAVAVKSAMRCCS